LSRRNLSTSLSGDRNHAGNMHHIWKHGARVMVEDKEVQHYAMHVDPVKKEVSCWIASEAGKEFTVVWLEHQADFPTVGYLYLDGHPVRGNLRLKIHDRFHKGPNVFRDVELSASLAAPYLFSPLIVTDDDTYLDNSSSSSVGEITLRIWRTAAPVVATDQRVYSKLPQRTKVHERSKKAVAHQVNYGNETIVPERKAYDAKVIERLVTFIFKYRPLEMLQANEIAPRNPESLESQEIALDTRPTSLVKREHFIPNVKSDSEEESEDEEGKRERSLLAEAQRCQAEAERCQMEVERIRKARNSNGDERPKKKVKAENKTFFIPGEVIDLT